MKTRLFIGNLAATVTEGELREKFEALLSSHQNEAEVGEVEVRCKNENNYFGYVDVHLKNGASQEVQVGTGSGGVGSRVPFFLRKYIDIMNNTKWKGSLIKVQPAKESFIEKLKKEQANRDQNDVKADHPKGSEQGPQGRNQSKDYNSEQSRNSRHANDILYKLNKSKERISRGGAGASQQFEKNENDKGGNFGFEIVTNDNSNSNKKSPSKRASTSSPKKRKRKNANSSSDDSSDDDVRDGIPKFKGLMACYPNGPPPPLTTPSIEDKKDEIQEDEKISEQPLIQKTVLPIAFDADDKKSKPLENKKNFDNHNRTDSSKSVESSGINFKKSKQQKSDMLRLQSLDKLKELKTQRSNIIKSSLSSVTAVPPSSENRKEIEEVHDEIQPKSKKSAMTLFDGNDSDDDDNSSDKGTFNVKKQFEGETGQRLLELQTRWGNDDRFKIDNRFKESDNEDEEMEPVEQEKEKQLNILTDILGKVLSPSKPHSAASKSKVNSSKETFSSVILPRYDPEADEDPAGVQQEESASKSKREKKEKGKLQESDKQEEKPIRSSEPVTFKTVSNLKALFSSPGDPDTVAEDASKDTEKAGTQSGSFSLLAAFGQTHDEEDDDDGAIAIKSTSAVPRSFWQANPFRYDSSDDENDDEKKDRVKVTINRDTKVSAKPSKSADLVIHGKSPFFFTKKDPRFEGLEDYFLKEEITVTNENGVEADNKEERAVEDYSVKRQELKAIVKAKIRNSKRKDEKRTLAIKRAIRKRKRKLHQRGVRQI